MKNKIAIAIKVIAVLQIIVGFFAGLIAANVEVSYTYLTGTYTEFNWTIAIIWWLASIITSIFLLGFAEIVHLLQKIADKVESNNKPFISSIIHEGKTE
ncbi:hypothetical protein [Halalkalibacter alkaliphilus]|uniref:Uncharacterized protein n=1 Tax=Halalkalibacter alkaliphilus TaxID=2917993 RepID=A0A9X2CVW4_9BACI|nr:hypothetical protein [Halalkalibacter alkaliphilus]MCL7749203.1 hypothetical protein [Halalkalibacter alkaliphilus]